MGVGKGGGYQSVKTLVVGGPGQKVQSAGEEAHPDGVGIFAKFRGGLVSL